MFQFPGFAFMSYEFRHKYLHLISTNPRLAPRMSFRTIRVTKLGVAEIEGGFPHSEIRGSKVVRTSPRLIAAYHVLHRLSAPRHPPNTLKTLDRSHYRRPPLGSGCSACALHVVDRKTFLLRTYPRTRRSSCAHTGCSPASGG